jgi:RNA polymerase sigma factor (sigma-70 family)
MKPSVIYYLVDHNGNPLSARYQAAVAQLHPAFVRKFPKFSDPADISNAVEDAARRVAKYEMDHGEVTSLRPFLIRVYTNVVNSMIRGGYYRNCEASTPDLQLEAYVACDFGRVRDNAENVILIGQALKRLDARKRRVLALHAEGFSAREIGGQLGMSERNVNTSLHRARAKIREFRDATALLKVS